MVKMIARRTHSSTTWGTVSENETFDCPPAYVAQCEEMGLGSRVIDGEPAPENDGEPVTDPDAIRKMIESGKAITSASVSTKKRKGKKT